MRKIKLNIYSISSIQQSFMNVWYSENIYIHIEREKCVLQTREILIIHFNFI